MSEMHPDEVEIDSLLRRSMAAPVPRLPHDFDRTLTREIRRRSERPSRYGQILLAGYGLMSAAASIVAMRSQGLSWGVTATMTLGPLVMLEAVRRGWRKQRESAASRQ